MAGMAGSAFQELAQSFQAEGRRVASCRAARAGEIEQRIQGLLREGLLDARVHEKYFRHMKFRPPDSFGSEASLLVAATPHHRTILVLDLPGGAFEATVPSTYLADRVRARNEETLRAALRERAFAPALLPFKTLAACVGLGAYGKDNVLRVDGMGSYARLDAWWVDADLGEAAWGPPRTLERCAACGACIRACPNACFREGSFVIDASRCLTFLNEGPGPFPPWLPARAHSAAIGCLRCQEACPENARHRRGVERRYVFDRQTSQAILEGKPAASLAPEAAELIRLLELEGEEEKLARNLAALQARA
jgi:epoxyqueuosine reductase